MDNQKILKIALEQSAFDYQCRSVKNALKCGFRPAWVEVLARSKEEVETCNRK